MPLRHARVLLLVPVLMVGEIGVARAQSAAPGATTDADGDDDPADSSQTTTGALRFGVYGDSDRTSVLRTLAEVTSIWGNWHLSGSADVDSVTSASVDVRSSPDLSKVDVVTSASGRTKTSGGNMTDKRLQATASAGWDDGAGHAATLSAAGAAETDYKSVSAGVNGSVDVLDRSITLLGGLRLTDNWIRSVLDPGLKRKMLNTGWSAGLAWVVTPRDALRLRYDGSASEGYQASPYRNVRFGNWTTSIGSHDQIMFENTIGSADGLPEKVPQSRLSHAAVLEWVHALGDGIGLHPTLRLGRDSWGVNSLTASTDLRVARPTWRLQAGYRYYHQSAADFFRTRYTMKPSMYDYYTSDKELGEEIGHVLNFDISKVLLAPKNIGDTRLLLDARLSVMYYRYPGFALLDSRLGAFAEIGLTWEL